MKQPAKLSIVGILIALVSAFLYPKLSSDDGAPNTASPSVTREDARAATSKAEQPRAESQKSEPSAATKPAKTNTGTSTVGFTSKKSFETHFEKHGHEFGKISAQQYLALAQALRDAPLSKDVVEAVRKQDRVISRFDRKSGAFIAFHDDQTIRTFFRPNDGEAYFKRQLDRLPQDDR